MPAALPIDQLIQPLSKEQVAQSILNLCASAGLKTTSWQSGGAALTIIDVISQLFAGFTVGISNFVRSGFLDLATGAFLTLDAYFTYGVLREEASYASTPCTVTNASGGLYTFKEGTFIASNSTTGITFVNLAPFTLQPTGNPGASQTVSMQAQTPGSPGTSSAGQIDHVVTSATGVSITNPTAAIGIDGESDELLRQRCRDKLGSLSPDGPKGAYEFVAKSATDSGGNPLGVTRVFVRTGTGDGLVFIYVAGASGALPSGDITIINDAIQRQAVPDSTLAVVHNSTNVVVDLTVDVWVYTAAGMSDADIEAATIAAMDAYFPTVPIGGFVLTSPPGALLFRPLEAIVKDAFGVNGIQAKFFPEADVSLGQGEVAVPGTFTVNVHQVIGP